MVSNNVLAQVCGGKALSIIRQVPRGNGLAMICSEVRGSLRIALHVHVGKSRRRAATG